MTTRKHTVHVSNPQNQAPVDVIAVPDPAGAEGDAATLLKIQQGLPMGDPLTPTARKKSDSRAARIPEAMIERAVQILAQNGGTIAGFTLDIGNAKAVLAYVHAYAPVAMQAIELGHRMEDDMRRRMEDLAQNMGVLLKALRVASEKDPNLLPYLRDLEALRPRRVRRSKKSGASPGAGAAASQAAVDAGSASQNERAFLVREAPLASNGTNHGTSNGASNGAASPLNGANGHA